MSISQLTSATNPFYASLQGSGTTSSGSASSGSSGLASASTFYNLLVTQLTNQDPLNPLSNQDLSAQLAQFSVANGVQAIQSSLTGLMSQINQNQGLQAASLIGKSVTTSGNRLQLSDGSATAAYDLASPANSVNVLVQNTAGQTVAVLPQGPQGAGLQSFSWNGQDNQGNPLPAGAYQFSVQATGANGQPVSSTSYMSGVVQSVTLGSSGPTLHLSGVDGSVPFNAVQNIL
ncbi:MULTISPECIES: flagellar hook assembly protein FlgD [Acidithiobacillus]|jgi:flagellar basal-body rod modification protein FlgD|uniref:Basal-body rod modification protein FlgD n=3 Tax=Acidithiobacillus caldus TaxID=33059 RepID=F9ZN68_ACICS|nr:MULTISPECIES: FlgD immunoglobulin-like domain containing protein [Acidithiobacillus]AEK58111.1 Flagellar basal-body rod modification protein FlgD [Acidithiobacillus caldus SM-1]AIA55101.1 Flagellar basal-body rod modification protein FlgD [Acidithiobacillus caldus ATCC 51756]AUW32756.1 flagellar biosynthesis protein FlgD [Acidithiobacillus caldus]MBU2730279.1 flagellar biosynthesis protein FlgD [Acidithiobacillus caldus]MBU2734352.1 flagellar biosynthesis protein FlgD [Acidithiobacillus cal